MPVAVPLAIAGASVVGAVAQSSAASSAAKAQTNAANQASATQQKMFDQAAGYEQPFIQGGQQAYGTLNDLLGVGGNSSTMQSTLEGLPGYQFTLDQGLKSTQNSYAARGLADSGGALKGAANYATGLANSTYGTYATQLQNSATLGANAANSLAGNAVQTGALQGGNQIGAGNAQAGASVATGNSIANAGNSLGQYYTLKNLLTSQQQPSSSDPGYYFNSGNSNYQNG